MEALEILLRLVGGFYLFAGIIGMRSLVMDHLMDLMLAGISMQPVPVKEHRRRWLLGSSTLAIGMGGMALMVLSLWAVPLFLFGAVTQAFYLAWARTAFAPEDDSERKGRSQTTNAAMIYFGATILVCVAALFGLLQPWLDPWALAIPVAGLGLLSLIGRHFLWRAGGPHDDLGGEPSLARQIPPPPARIRLAPMKGFYPVRNADNDDGVIYDDYVPEPLGDRIYEWIQPFRSNDDWDDPDFWAEFTSPGDEARHRAEGAAIVTELEAIFGAGNVEGPAYPDDIRYVP